MKTSQILLIGGILLLAVGLFKSPEIIRALNNGGTPGPAPVPSVALRNLVDAESADKLAAFYRDFAGVVEAGGLQTTDDFRQAQAIAATHLKAVDRLPDMAAVNKPISDWVAAKVGLDSKPLDQQTRATLTQTLRDISQGFAG